MENKHKVISSGKDFLWKATEKGENLDFHFSSTNKRRGFKERAYTYNKGFLSNNVHDKDFNGIK